MKGATILLLRKNKAKRLGKIVRKQNGTNANLTCTMSSEEVKARKQPDEVNKCPPVLRKSVSWQILTSFLGILIEATCAGLKSFFSVKINLNTAQSFSNTRKTVVKKPASKLQGDFLLLSGQVLQFNWENRLLFTVKRNCSVFIHDLERVNEFLRLNSRVKFSSNKVEVACPFICHRKY